MTGPDWLLKIILFLIFILEVRGFFHSTCQLHSKWLSLTPQERSSAMAHQIQIKYNEVITMATSTITKKLTTYDLPALITCVIGLWTVSDFSEFNISCLEKYLNYRYIHILKDVSKISFASSIKMSGI